jgi:hypothetical protein
MVTATTLVIYLPPVQVPSSQTSAQNSLGLTLYLADNIGTYHREDRAFVLCSCLLLRERVYRAVAQKQTWYIGPSRGRYIATAQHATISIKGIIIKCTE